MPGISQKEGKIRKFPFDYIIFEEEKL